ncbi:MAG: hypothetical protein CL424_20110 [Acidimicrobiaceae bacterium]|nr:hypothetical protein [Acidimicrobiaceae bacterium]
MTLNRSRWAAVGAAVAVTLGAGGIGLVRAATPESDPSVFVPITNCRIFDTRSNHDIGPFNEPLGPDSEITVDGHGETGNCVIPETATALQLNMTAVLATETTHLTVWPADAEMPTSSSMNPQFGHGTAYNAVTTRLSPTGEFKVYNLLGEVGVIADVTGYFVAAENAPSGPAPAAAAADGEDVADIGTDDATVVDATISVDGPGIVQATAVGTASGDVAADDLWCSLSDTTVFDDGSVQKVQLTAADAPTNMTVMRSFEVAEAGDLTASLVCKVSGTATATVENPQLSLTYLPAEAPAETTTTVAAP